MDRMIPNCSMCKPLKMTVHLQHYLSPLLNCFYLGRDLCCMDLS